MMKYFFSIFFIFIMLFFDSSFFWMIIGVISFLMLCFIYNSLSFSMELMLSSFIYMDMLSFSLIFLSFWVIFLMYMSSQSIYNSFNNLLYYSFCLLFLLVILMMTFFCVDMMTFYFYFEASLIPTLLIIMGWGYQPERLQAGVYFLFYTITASLPLLLLISYIWLDYATLSFFTMSFYFWGDLFGGFFFLFMVLAFLVSMPMFFVHLWLPKAHVEAPVSGSMILAGVLLKLGGFGLFRVLILCQNSLKFYGGYMFGLSIMGMMYVGFICCRLTDMKALVAYSSVAHMSLVICGVYSSYFYGYEGALLMMLTHGLTSSGLFCIVNTYYERSSSRSLYLNKGMILLSPSLTLFMFLLAASNMAAPPTLNLLSEILLMISIMKFDCLMILMFPLATYLGAVFTLFLFSFSQHGVSFSSLYSYLIPSYREYHILFMHILPVNFLILNSGYFLHLC